MGTINLDPPSNPRKPYKDRLSPKLYHLWSDPPAPVHTVQKLVGAVSCARSWEFPESGGVRAGGSNHQKILQTSIKNLKVFTYIP